MITFRSKGNWDSTIKYLKSISDSKVRETLNYYGQKGVDILREATPKDTGKTAASWSYYITKTSKGWTLNWNNSNVVNKTPVVIVLIYGHGTRNGGYVPPNDFVTPAMKPLFEEIANEAWRRIYT
jgi:hypothetical protein